MRRPPTYAAPAQTASFTTGAASKTASATWAAGDTVVVIGLAENSMTGWDSLPTASGLTFAAQALTPFDGNTAGAGIWTATAAAAGSAVTVTKTTGDASPHWGFMVYSFHNCEGFGTAVMQTTSTRTVSLTPTRRKSLILWGVGDWSAVALVAETPTASVDRLQTRDNPSYACYYEELRPVPSTAPLSIGLTGSGGGPWSIVGIEIYGVGRDEVKRPRRLR